MPVVTALPHPKLTRTLAELSADRAYLSRCRVAPPPLLARGIEEFNERKFFECHETLEELWRAEEAQIRYLYQGILQIGVGYYHLGRGNYHGAVTKLGSGCDLITHYLPRCQGVDVAGLLEAARLSQRRLLELGPARIAGFDDRLVPTITLTSS